MKKTIIQLQVSWTLIIIYLMMISWEIISMMIKWPKKHFRNYPMILIMLECQWMQFKDQIAMTLVEIVTKIMNLVTKNFSRRCKNAWVLTWIKDPEMGAIIKIWSKHKKERWSSKHMEVFKLHSVKICEHLYQIIHWMDLVI